MLKWNRMAILVLIVFLLAPKLSIESHSQGLEWGFSEEDRFDFLTTYRSVQNTTTINLSEESYYVIAPELPEIDDPLNNDNYIPYTRAFTYYPNGTQIPAPRLRFAVPIGNWSLLSKIMESSIIRLNQSGEIREDNDCWGYKAVTDEAPFFITTTIAEFSKVDGVLLRFIHKEDSLSHGQQNIIETLRQNSPLKLQEIVSISAAVVLVILFIGFYHYRYRK